MFVFSFLESTVLNRRKHRRRRSLQMQGVFLRWRDESGIQSADARLVDISMGGCCVLTAHALSAGAVLVTKINLGESRRAKFPPVVMIGRVVAARPHEGEFQCSIEFSPNQEDKQRPLHEAIFSDAYTEVGRDADLISTRAFWGVEQWAAYLTAQPLPVLPYSQHLLAALDDEESDNDLSMADIAGIAVNDPFLVLMLLRKAETQKSARLNQHVSTVLGAVMYLGITAVKSSILESPVADDANEGLMASSEKAILAGRLARAWAACRYDVNVEEVVLAALLANIGEQMLWHFAPEVPQGVLDAMQVRGITSFEAAQLATCGFKFSDLTLRCVSAWQLPTPLMRGAGSLRAAIPRLAVNIAGYIRENDHSDALTNELNALAACIPSVSKETLIRMMNEVAGIDFSQPTFENSATLHHP
jgi:hypothetical protein